jgi:hypothetical protein
MQIWLNGKHFIMTMSENVWTSANCDGNRTDYYVIIVSEHITKFPLILYMVFIVQTYQTSQ